MHSSFNRARFENLGDHVPNLMGGLQLLLWLGGPKLMNFNFAIKLINVLLTEVMDTLEISQDIKHTLFYC